MFRSGRCLHHREVVLSGIPSPGVPAKVGLVYCLSPGLESGFFHSPPGLGAGWCGLVTLSVVGGLASYGHFG